MTTTMLIAEPSFLRLEAEIRAINPELNVVVMRPDGSLATQGQPVTLAEIDPEIAWLNVDLARANLTRHYVQTVLDSGTVKWLQTFNAGLDQAFYQEILTQGIRISASSAQAIAIAEYVIGNVLAQYQDVFRRKQYQRAHEWQRTTFQELWRSCWLIVGFGNIGQALAERVDAFEVKVIGVRRSGQAHPAADIVVTPADLAEYLPQADVVVLACPLNDETKGLADAPFFQRMKPGAILVNIARGRVVDTPALIAALNGGALAHAVLDVFDPEPLPADSPLWDMEKITISPHSSNGGQGTPLRGDLLFLENLGRYLENESLLNEANG